MAKSNVDAHLEISPESAIVFELDAQASETKVILNLKHPDPDSPAVAFKVCKRKMDIHTWIVSHTVCLHCFL